MTLTLFLFLSFTSLLGLLLVLLVKGLLKKLSIYCFNNNTYSKELNQLFVFNLVFRLDTFSLKGETSKNEDGVLQDSDGVFELGNEFTSLFGQDGVGAEQVVLNSFTDTESGGLIYS